MFSGLQLALITFIKWTLLLQSVMINKSVLLIFSFWFIFKGLMANNLWIFINLLHSRPTTLLRLHDIAGLFLRVQTLEGRTWGDVIPCKARGILFGTLARFRLIRRLISGVIHRERVLVASSSVTLSLLIDDAFDSLYRVFSVWATRSSCVRFKESLLLLLHYLCVMVGLLLGCVWGLCL